METFIVESTELNFKLYYYMRRLPKSYTRQHQHIQYVENQLLGKIM